MNVPRRGDLPHANGERGLPYLTSEVGEGEGVQKKQTKRKKNQLICDSDKGETVKKSQNFADVIYGSPKEERSFSRKNLSRSVGK